MNTWVHIYIYIRFMNVKQTLNYWLMSLQEQKRPFGCHVSIIWHIDVMFTYVVHMKWNFNTRTNTIVMLKTYTVECLMFANI